MAEIDIAPVQPLRPSGFTANKLAADLFAVLFLIVWETASYIAPAYLIPGPILVVQRLAAFVTSRHDLGHLGASLFHVAAAVAISFVIGSLLALIPYYVPVLRFAIERRIGPFLNAFSAIGWTLLSIMWFGVTPLTVIFAISAVLVPFALVNMSAGLANIDAEFIEMAGSFTRPARTDVRTGDRAVALSVHIRDAAHHVRCRLEGHTDRRIVRRQFRARLHDQPVTAGV